MVVTIVPIVSFVTRNLEFASNHRMPMPSYPIFTRSSPKREKYFTRSLFGIHSMPSFPLYEGIPTKLLIHS